MSYPEKVIDRSGVVLVPYQVFHYDTLDDDTVRYDVSCGVERIESEQWFPTAGEAEEWIRHPRS